MAVYLLPLYPVHINLITPVCVIYLLFSCLKPSCDLNRQQRSFTIFSLKPFLPDWKKIFGHLTTSLVSFDWTKHVLQTWNILPSYKRYLQICAISNVTIHVHEHEQINNISHDPAVNPGAGSQQTWQHKWRFGGKWKRLEFWNFVVYKKWNNFFISFNLFCPNVKTCCIRTKGPNKVVLVVSV